MTVATSRLDFIHASPPRIEVGELAPILEKFHSTIAGWTTAPPPAAVKPEPPVEKALNEEAGSIDELEPPGV
jgi:hypothetical protein